MASAGAVGFREMIETPKPTTNATSTQMTMGHLDRE
jgi:hypothetical protein